MREDIRSARWPTFGRLRFSGDLESVSDHYAEHSMPYVRFAIVLAIVLYALFGVLDLFIVPDVAPWIWLIRYAIFCPISLFVLVVSFNPTVRRIMQPVLARWPPRAGSASWPWWRSPTPRPATCTTRACCS